MASCWICSYHFKPTKADNRYCDTCSIALLKPLTNKTNDQLNRKHNKIRDWEDTSMKKQWREASDKSMKAILAKCKGDKYSN